MKASVIITTYNDDLRLQHALWGWAGQSEKEFQLILVNDGGDDGKRTEELFVSFEKYIRKLDYVYLGPSKKELGGQVFRLAAARNAGLRHAVGETTIISDCDTIPRPDVVELMTKNARKDRVLIGIRKRIPEYLVTGLSREHFPRMESLVHADDERLVNPNWRPIFLSLKDTAPVGSWGLCWGCLFAAPTEHLKSLGGFDERFRSWGGEDDDMAERLVRAKDCKFLAMPEAVVYHLDHPPRCPAPYQGMKHLVEIRREWRPVRNGGPIP